MQLFGMTAAALIVLAFHCQASSDFKGLKIEMVNVAAKIATTLKEEGQDKIAFRDFTSPAILQANFGLALKDELQSALKDKSITVDIQAKYEIGGEYRIVKDAETDAAKRTDLDGLLIVFEIKDQATGKTMEKFSQQVFDNSLISAASGVNGSFKPTGTTEERNEEVHNKIKEPEFNITNSIVVVDNFGMEIGVMKGDTFEARAVAVKNKVPFVELNHGERYTIRLYNNAEFDVGVMLTVDGVSTFRFSEIKNESGDKKGESRFSHWIVPAKKFVLISGWHKDMKQVYDFVITDVLNSAAGQLKVTGSIGVINAQFHAVTAGGEHNADEGKTRSAEAATGKGPPRDAASKEVAVQMGAMRTSVTIRYGK